LPATVAIQPPGASRSFPVLSLEEVGLAFEEHRETLDRWRQRTREAAAGAA